MTARIALPLAVVAFLLLLWLALPIITAATQPTYTVGSIATRDGDAIVSLTTSTSLAAGNYDTLEAPQGTPYETLGALTVAVVSSASAGVLGYGDSDVQDSATPPTNAVVVCAFVGNEPSVWCPLPAGVHPFVALDDGGTAQVTGVLR